VCVSVCMYVCVNVKWFMIIEIVSSVRKRVDFVICISVPGVNKQNGSKCFKCFKILDGYNYDLMLPIFIDGQRATDS
jgi:hypothetical protein